MLRFYAEKFCRLSTALMARSAIYKMNDRTLVTAGVDPEHFQQLQMVVADAERLCSAMGLSFAATQARWIVERLESPVTLGTLAEWLAELNRRVEDELESRVFLSISPKEARFWSADLSEWGETQHSFPLCSDKVESAGRCLAVGLPDACVFYLLSVAQDGIIALARHLQKDVNPETDDWKTIIDKIDAGVQTKRASMSVADWKSVEPFYAEAASDLKAMKNAWRNPTLHFRRAYQPAEAEKVYARVRDYMVHVSTKIKG